VPAGTLGANAGPQQSACTCSTRGCNWAAAWKLQVSACISRMQAYHSTAARRTLLRIDAAAWQVQQRINAAAWHVQARIDAAAWHLQA
jgi:hypothetical protein